MTDAKTWLLLSTVLIAFGLVNWGWVLMMRKAGLAGVPGSGRVATAIFTLAILVGVVFAIVWVAIAVIEA